ncbi:MULTISPECIES: class I adenylate-forming enzyme family protein [Rhodococcus]|uniref:Acid-CoA ligase n=1 Tax=Rhodococcus opacus RKJ300 = JCM 13270 TaxID=1165867 RepID=I0WW54_RHOOP|nr:MULTISPECIES: AMP-binding protein [Rhodococcus]EID80620.1 acid-CoA ligase [Rhodococcus opacus RKJ300 = JCM 13270]QQZ11801.1 AMP-binding protein [Rhodococcus sp. 21391]
MAPAYLPWLLAEPFGSAPAIRDDLREFSFEQLDARVAAVAAQFAGRDVGRGDVVAVMLPNRSELVVAIFAAWRLGAAVTPVNPSFTEQEATHQIADAGATLVVNAGPGAPTGGKPTIAVDDLAEHSTGEVPAPVELADSDMALVIYTSGSTGRPKGVMITHGNADAMTASIVEVMALTTSDHCLLILPLFHANALMVSLLASLRVGAQLTVVGKFSPDTFFHAVEKHRPSYFSGVPTIFALLVTKAAERDTDLSSLRFAICGAAPATRELLQASEEMLGAPLLEGYGLTEATCASAINPLVGLRKIGTVGPSLPGQSIRVVDDELRDVPTGETGEVLITGPVVMAGYLGNPEATEKTIVDGWVRTGDVGVLDSDGYLTLVDRIKDMIIRGGENLYPKEIENAIGSLPGVLEVAVIGRPDDVMGEVPVAFVVPYPDASLTPETVIEHCRNLLTRVKVPVAVDIVTELPKNPVGKIDKPGLRKALVG